MAAILVDSVESVFSKEAGVEEPPCRQVSHARKLNVARPTDLPWPQRHHSGWAKWRVPAMQGEDARKRRNRRIRGDKGKGGSGTKVLVEAGVSVNAAGQRN